MIKIKDIIIGVILGLIIALLVILIIKLGKEDENNYKECIKHYSESYCTKTIYGVY